MEFKKYEQLGAYHWREFEKQTIYGKHANLVYDWVREGKTLDVGAGDGLITHLLDCEGIDDNTTAVNLAKKMGANVKIGSAYKLEYPDFYFDNILMADVIEHLEFPEKAILESKRVLKPNGHLYITTPPKLKQGLHDHYHYKEYSPSELKSFIENMGFKLVVPISMKYVRMYAEFRKILK